MKLQKKILLAATCVLMTAPFTTLASSVNAQEWQARTIKEVKAELEINEQDQTVYTIKYGDTLGVIAEALEIDVVVLGSINAIADLDLIFPGTVLTLTYDENQIAKTVMIESLDSEMEAEINLAENELVVNGESFDLPESESVENQTVAPVFYTEPVEEWIPVTTEAPVEATIETTTIEVVPETTEVEEWIPVTTEALAEITEPVIEETTQSLVEETEVTDLETTEATIVEEIETPVVEETTEYFEEVTEIEESQEPVIEETSEFYEVPVIEETSEYYEEPVVEETTEYYEEVTEAPVYDPTSEGLQPHVAQFKNEVANAFGITSFSNYRPGDGGDHGQGLAVDFMVPIGSTLGDQVAQYAISQIGSSNISYVIWNQQIYGDWNMAWEMMEDRGSVTANHMDHVHVSFYP